MNYSFLSQKSEKLIHHNITTSNHIDSYLEIGTLKK